MKDKSAAPLLPYGGSRDRPAPAPSRQQQAGEQRSAAPAQAATGGSDTHAAVEVNDLRVHYATQADPVLSVSHLRVARGECLALTGANGAGKSTLLKSLTGLVRADHGSIRVFGLPPERARGCIAYLPQLRAVDWHYPISVSDFALLGCAVRLGWLRRANQFWRTRAEDLLQRLHLHPLRSRQIRALSGGEQQRLLLVRALLADPDLFLLDEPLTAVDADSVTLIGDILESEHRAGKTLIVATHHLDFGKTFRFDRELQLHCGCVHAVRTGKDAAPSGSDDGQIIVRQLSARVAFYSGSEAASHLPRANVKPQGDWRSDAAPSATADSDAATEVTTTAAGDAGNAVAPITEPTDTGATPTTNKDSGQGGNA